MAGQINPNNVANEIAFVESRAALPSPLLVHALFLRDREARRESALHGERMQQRGGQRPSSRQVAFALRR